MAAIRPRWLLDGHRCAVCVVPRLRLLPLSCGELGPPERPREGAPAGAGGIDPRGEVCGGAGVGVGQ